MSTNEDTTTIAKKEMAPTAKYLNVAVQLILLVIVAFIVTRTVNSVGIILFTWHPVLISIGVSLSDNYNDAMIHTFFILHVLVSHSDVACYLEYGRQQLSNSVADLSEKSDCPLGSTNFSSNSHYNCSNLHLHQQKHARKRTLHNNALAVRIDYLSTDCRVIARWYLHEV